ncbi:MAG: TIGR02594 family protein [Marinilabiliales bacterium]|nr:MAG: TIGR02594 family protein [Marinilabiliales bacterium]
MIEIKKISREQKTIALLILLSVIAFILFRPRRIVAFKKAMKLFGTTEIPGSSHNPVIINFFREVGFPGVVTDETSWCAGFANYILKKSGAKYIKSLLARDLLKLPGKVSKPKKGDIMVFWRQDPNSVWGHVGFYVSESSSHYKILGGNQRNSVSFLDMPKSRLLGIRRPQRI